MAHSTAISRMSMNEGPNDEAPRRQTAVASRGPRFAWGAGGVPTSTVDTGTLLVAAGRNSTGSYVGQSFTTVSGGHVTSIKTTAFGGVSPGTQQSNGVAASSIIIRYYVNDVEVPIGAGAPHALSGSMIETSTPLPTIINHDYGSTYPTVEFLFSGTTVLAPNTKYVMEFVNGAGVYPYVKIYHSTPPGDYTGGQAYDINGYNLTATRDFPFELWTYN